MNNQNIIDFVRTTFKEPTAFVPLHAPYFGGNEKAYLMQTIDSTFVSTVGEYVTLFEQQMQAFTGAKYAIAIVNGTCALHLALKVVGVMQGDEVITQSLTFVATANAISHAGGIPVFVDVDMDTMGLSPKSLATFLEKNTVQNPQNECINVDTGRRIAAVLPMHTFGFCTHIEEIAAICAKHNIPLVEDAAESLGSYYKGKHTGRFGKVGTFSFNGNKTITCGGGGAIITDDDEIGKLAKHLSTTAKKAHAWEFAHDMIAYNYRMPNLNAALACAQLEQLPKFLENKRELADLYTDFFENSDITFVRERPNTTANYWLNTILMPDAAAKEVLLEFTNKNGVMTRPIWQLMNRLPMYENCQKTDTPNAEWLEARVVNIPSSFRP